MSDSKIKPPAGIEGEARAEFARVIESIESLGRKVGPADLQIICLYARNFQVNLEAFAAVRKNGQTVTRPGGVVVMSGEMKTFLESSKLLKNLMTELRITPASRRDEKPAFDEELEI